MALQQLRLDVSRRWTDTSRGAVKGPLDMSRTLQSGTATQMICSCVTAQHAVGSTGSNSCSMRGASPGSEAHEAQRCHSLQQLPDSVLKP